MITPASASAKANGRARCRPAEAGALAVMAAALCVGETWIPGSVEDLACSGLARSCAALGAIITNRDGGVSIRGVGVGGLAPVDGDLHAEGPVALASLLGALTGHPFASRVTADPAWDEATLLTMASVLRSTGATIALPERACGVILVHGARDPLPCEASSSALGDPAVATAALFAGLHAAGDTRLLVAPPAPLAAEVVLTAFGARIEARLQGDARCIILHGLPELVPCRELSFIEPGPQT